MSDLKFVFHTPSTIIKGHKVRHTMNFETLAIWKVLTKASIKNCENKEESVEIKGYEKDEIKDMLETQYQRLHIAEREIDKFGSKSKKRGIIQDISAPLIVNYYNRGEEWNRLISLETKQDTII
jgi:hypothetical protein